MFSFVLLTTKLFALYSALRYLAWLIKLNPLNEPMFEADRAEEGTYEPRSIAVLVAFRNEEAHLPELMSALSRLQTRANAQLEFLLVDDSSTDRSVEIVREASRVDARFRCLSSAGQGKKAALRSGFESIKSEWVALTDADVQLPEDWLPSLFKDLSPLEVLRLGPVYPHSDGRNLARRFFELDHFSMSLSAICEADRNKPGLSYGANMAVRTDFRRSLDEAELMPHLDSGDDVFLLEAARKHLPGHPIRMMRSAAVSTEVPLGWGDWAKQRIRWASKAPSYPDSPIRDLAWTVWLGALACVLMPWVFGLWGWIYWAVKAIVESLLLIRGARILGRPKDQVRGWIRILPMAVLIQPISVLAFSLIALRPRKPSSENRSRSGFERAANRSGEPRR